MSTAARNNGSPPAAPAGAEECLEISGEGRLYTSCIKEGPSKKGKFFIVAENFAPTRTWSRCRWRPGDWTERTVLAGATHTLS